MHKIKLIMLSPLVFLVLLVAVCAPPEKKNARHPDPYILHYQGFTVKYNPSTRQPDWVSYTLTANQVYRTENTPKINHHFMPDPKVKYPQATNEDYKGSGWSRGHMARHMDMKWSVQAAHESDYYTNICPQSMKLNNGIWKGIENIARGYAKQFGSVNIVCGPVFTDTVYGAIGESRIPIPDFFFKSFLVYRSGHYHAIAFLCPNDGASKTICTVNDIESLTGINLYAFLDEQIEEHVENVVDRSFWF